MTSCRVAIVGCGRMGQHYAEVYQALPDTDVVAIAEYDPERRRAMGERFGVGALFPDAAAMLREVVPDIAAVVLPGKYIKDAVVACAEAGVRGVSTDKPIGACLTDVDAMVEVCRERGVVFAGGNLQRAMGQVQEAAAWLRAGQFGKLTGASVHGWGGEISGGGCQGLSVLRLFTADAEVDWVTGWCSDDGHSDATSAWVATCASPTAATLSFTASARRWRALRCCAARACTTQTGTATISGAGKPTANWRKTWAFSRSSGVPSAGWSPAARVSDAGIQSIVDSLDKGIEPRCSGANMRKVLEIAIGLRESHRNGITKVEFPITDRSLRIFPAPSRFLNKKEVMSPEQYTEQIKASAGKPMGGAVG